MTIRNLLMAAAGAAAGIKFVGSYSTNGVGASLTASFGGNLTGGIDTTPRTGDLVIVSAVSCNGSQLTYGVSTTGYSTVVNNLYGNNTGTTADACVGVFYKLMGATPDTSVTVTCSASVAYMVTVYVLRGADPYLPLDATPTTSTTVTNSVPPNPPAITPATVGAAVVAIGGGAGIGTATRLTSSDLSNFVAQGTGYAETGIGVIYNWASGAVDPAAYGGGSGVANLRASGSVTMAIRPNQNKTLPAFINSAMTQGANTTVTIAKPTNTQQGDLMIAFLSAGTKQGTWTGDTGWAEIADQNSSSGASLRIAYKVAGASEGPSYTFTCSNTNASLAGTILTYRGAAYDAIGSFVAGADPLTPTGPSAAANFSLLLGFAALDASGTITSNMGTQRFSSTTSHARYIGEDVVAAGATGTRSFNMGSTGNSGAILMTIKPA